MKTLIALLLVILTACSKEPFLTEDSGTFKDSRDNHKYKWVRIGEQLWMADNLAYLPVVNPSSEGSESSAFYYVYSYEGSSINEAKSKDNYTTFGVLYNWEAAKTACPSGWHLPTDEEWTILENFLGELPGKKMKSKSRWSENGNGDNSSGFNAIPGGGRYNHVGFSGLGFNTLFWSSSDGGGWGAHWGARYRSLYYYYNGMYRYYDSRDHGFTIRCVKDN